MRQKINTSSLDISIEEAKKNLEKLIKQKESAEAMIKQKISVKRNEAKKSIEEKISQISDLVNECKELADEYELDFYLNPSGNGGVNYYSPKNLFKGDSEDDWSSSSEGWVSSSDNC